MFLHSRGAFWSTHSLFYCFATLPVLSVYLCIHRQLVGGWHDMKKLHVQMH